MRKSKISIHRVLLVREPLSAVIGAGDEETKRLLFKANARGSEKADGKWGSGIGGTTVSKTSAEFVYEWLIDVKEDYL